jgi:PAS domain S-box-containing protein
MVFSLPDGGSGAGGADAGSAAWRAYLTTLFEHIPLAVVVLDPADRMTGANPAFCRMFGYSAEELVGRSLPELLAPEPLPRDASLRAHLALPSEGAAVETVLRRRDGSLIDVAVQRHAVRLEGEPVARYAFYQRLSEQKRIAGERKELLIHEPHEGEVELGDERERQILAAARALLAGEESVDTLLKRLARFLVPAVADSCILYLRERHDSVSRAEIALADPAQEELLREHLLNYPPVLARLIPPVAHALLTGEPQLLPEVRLRALKAVPGDDEHVSIASALGLASLLVVPLVCDGRVLGVLSLGSLDPGRCYQAGDLPLAGEIARHAAAVLTRRPH